VFCTVQLYRQAWWIATLAAAERAICSVFCTVQLYRQACWPAAERYVLCFVQFNCTDNRGRKLPWQQLRELFVLCFVQFNCTDKCPKYAQYMYTKETKDGDKITLCVAEDYNVLGYVYVASPNSRYNF